MQPRRFARGTRDGARARVHQTPRVGHERRRGGRVRRRRHRRREAEAEAHRATGTARRRAAQLVRLRRRDVRHVRFVSHVGPAGVLAARLPEVRALLRGVPPGV